MAQGVGCLAMPGLQLPVADPWKTSRFKEASRHEGLSLRPLVFDMCLAD